jgi:molybdopterin-guanine dinucleotide biosynthesis protein A
VDARFAPQVLVLAGRRATERSVDLGAPSKALVAIDGVPMLERVLASLLPVAGDGPVFVSAGDAALLDATPALRAWAAAGRLRHHPSAASPAASVHDFLSRTAGGGPTFVTTADHPLLTTEMVRHFLDAAEATGADVVVAVVEASCFRARFPHVRRTFVPLRGDAVTGANLFLFRTRGAASAARFWLRAEAVRKKPWKLVALFGPVALARFAVRRLDLDEAVARVSATIGVRAAVVRMPFAECAIDVDTAADLEVASRLLAARRAGVPPA